MRPARALVLEVVRESEASAGGGSTLIAWVRGVEAGLAEGPALAGCTRQAGSQAEVGRGPRGLGQEGFSPPGSAGGEVKGLRGGPRFAESTGL